MIYNNQKEESEKSGMSRRKMLSALGLAGAMAVPGASFANSEPKKFPVDRTKVKITKLETFLVKPRWVFLKIHTDAGVVGLGEPLLEGRAQTIQTAIKEIEPYLIGKDPRDVTHHWQAIYRHSFYKGGPILTSALSGIDHALWDIKGKLLNVPVYELLGGPTRDRVRIYGRASNAEQMRQRKAEGYTIIKTGVKKDRPARAIENRAFIKNAVDNFAELREAGGDGMDIGIDFHGSIPPQTSKILIKELEQFQPMFIEEPCQPQNVDVLADIARSTHLPIATGERIFTKWGFREILEKGAASILQPDMCHCGGISEARIIAGMAESYYAYIAPHNPMGPISLATGLQLAASIPNFLVQEQVSLGEGYIKEPFKLEKDGHVMIPNKPGLGVELDEDKISDKLDHDWRNPETYDAFDGSVTDW
ncbi:MAG: galactonate dehydratase [Cytophagales bacterium]|nr:galactonate dehydratase [Cytophagales bacterium]